MFTNLSKDNHNIQYSLNKQILAFQAFFPKWKAEKESLRWDIKLLHSRSSLQGPFSVAAQTRWPAESKVELLAESDRNKDSMSISGCFWGLSSLKWSSRLMLGVMRIMVSKGEQTLVDTHRAHGRVGGDSVFALCLSEVAYKCVTISFLLFKKQCRTWFLSWQ